MMPCVVGRTLVLLMLIILLCPQLCSGSSLSYSRADHNRMLQSEVLDEYPSYSFSFMVGQTIPLARCEAAVRVGFIDFGSNDGTVKFGFQIESKEIQNVFVESWLKSVSFAVKLYPFLYLNGEKDWNYWVENRTYTTLGCTLNSNYMKQTIQMGSVPESNISDVTSVGGIIEFVDLTAKIGNEYSENSDRVISCTPDFVRFGVNFTSMVKDVSETEVSIESNNDTSLDLTDSSVMVHLSEPIGISGAGRLLLFAVSAAAFVTASWIALDKLNSRLEKRRSRIVS
jgi:hypothetical protein